MKLPFAPEYGDGTIYGITRTGVSELSETRTRNEVTGGEKGVKPERFSLIPARPMEEVARVYGYGASKYAPHNWRKGYEWSKAMDALERHLTAFKRREDFDPESGLHHLSHCVFHCLSLLEWTLTHPELDDREGWVAPGKIAGAGEHLSLVGSPASNAGTPGMKSDQDFLL